MIKYDLREQGFSVREKFNKTFFITLIWVAITLLMIVGTVIALFGLAEYTPAVGMDAEGGSVRSPIDVEFDIGNVPLYVFYFLFVLLLYLALKFILTFIFCRDRYNNVKLSILDGKGFPVCQCREAFKTWQTVAIYLLPIVIIYALMYMMCNIQNIMDLKFAAPAEGGGGLVVFSDTSLDAGFTTILLFMSFFFAFDLTLVVYVLFLKITHGIDYIAIDRHVYAMTLYKAIYIKSGGKKIKKRFVEPPREKEKEKFFVKTTACGNRKCENYGAELENNQKTCPVCGGRTYKAEIFAKVTTCVNENCENYGQELDANLEVCSICGRETGKLALKFSPWLKFPAIAAAIASAAVFGLIHAALYNYNIKGGVLVNLVFMLQTAAGIISIVMGVSSKSKAALFIAVLSALFTAFGITIILSVI